MNKVVKYLIIGVPVAILGYIIYKELKNKKKKVSFTPNNNTNNTFIPPQETQSNNGTVTDPFPLKRGMAYSKKVEALQFALNHIPRAKTPGYLGCEYKCKNKPLAEDGIFGKKTEELLFDTFGDDAFPNGVTKDDLDKIYTHVVLDPNAYAAAENPYIIQQNITYPTTTIDWSSGFPNVIVN